MDRVETLLQQLQKQFSEKASLDAMLITVQMIEAEIMHLKTSDSSETSSHSPVKVDIPVFHPAITPPDVKEEEKIVQVLQIDEAEVEAELEEIKRNVETLNKISAANKPVMQFDPVEDTPTLLHQQPAVAVQSLVNDIPTIPASLNDRLKQTKVELTDSLQETAIKDLRKAIGLNDRFRFINELFRGDEVMYERSIKTINGFSILPEAEFWIRRELKLKLGWNDTNPVVKQFDQLVKRRFFSM